VKRTGYLDPAGAVEQARRQKLQNTKIAIIAKSSPQLDIPTEMRRHSAALDDVPPVVKGAAISLSPEFEQVARDAELSPPAPILLPPLSPLESVSRRTGAVTRAVPNLFAEAKAEKARRDAAAMEAQAAQNRSALGTGSGPSSQIKTKRTP
jgi:hypothetical protein